MKQDTIYNSPTLNVSLLADVQLNELPKATGVVVVHRLRVAESLHDGAAKKSGQQRVLIRVGKNTARTFPQMPGHMRARKVGNQKDQRRLCFFIEEPDFPSTCWNGFIMTIHLEGKISHLLCCDAPRCSTELVPAQVSLGLYTHKPGTARKRLLFQFWDLRKSSPENSTHWLYVLRATHLTSLGLL